MVTDLNSYSMKSIKMEIAHDLNQRKFYIIVDNLESHLEYVKTDNIINLNHTFVPYELRGKGIAGQLVKAALNFAEENNLKIIPSCSYVADYFQRHKECKKLLA
jgi:uncharacterized protein